jgi:hypothetical protein
MANEKRSQHWRQRHGSRKALLLGEQFPAQERSTTLWRWDGTIRIGDGRHVDLFRYIGWLISVRNEPRPEGAGYEALKDRARARSASLSIEGRDIGDLPSVQDQERKARGIHDFQYFCESHFPQTFHLRWSQDHLKVIAKIEQAVLKGGLFALAMPRGSGKTTIAESACLWAILYGHRDFVALIGASEEHAEEMLDSIKTELDCNDLLLEDFPEAVHPIRCLEGIANRCAGQLYHGERTHVTWTAREIVLPTIPGSPASGAIIKVAGITGRIRGLKHKCVDGKTCRPSLVVLDDPQTDESARSVSQCAHRERLLAGAILGLAGPGKKISGIMPCTVINPGDIADNILNREKHPEWNGERTRMVYCFPTNDKFWIRYADIRGESLRQHGDLRDATAFYSENQQVMDEGAHIAWPERFNHDEVSAVQHAMNLKLQDEAAFCAEYQNEPLVATHIDEALLTADQVAGKLNGLNHGAVPIGVNHLTMFVDVQQDVLFYLVAAWEQDFTGYVIDYGTFPDQQRRYFTLRDARVTLAAVTRKAGVEGALYAGLETLVQKLLGRAWRRDDGAEMRIERCLIDANWGSSTDLVYQFCRQNAFSAVLMPSHGRFVGASSYPFSEYRPKPGDRCGLNWRIPAAPGRRAVRHVLFDTNFWKSFTHSRLKVAMGDRGCLSLFGHDPEAHRLLADHLTSEYPVKTEARGRSVDEWKLKVERPDNHWFDCMVGTAVAASMAGVNLFGQTAARPRRRPRVSYF